MPGANESTLNVAVPTTELSGKYRLVRTGTNLVVLYDTGAGWQELAQGTVPSSSAQVYLMNGSVNAATATPTTFGHFKINSGLTTYQP